MIKWSGRILVFLGIVHVVLSVALTIPTHAAAWFSGDLWRPEGGIAAMNPSLGAYWFSFGSFGPPLLAIGLTVLWMHRRGIVPPAFLGWTLLAWMLVNAVIFLFSPWLLGAATVVLYLVGVRRAGQTAADGVAVPAG